MRFSGLPRAAHMLIGVRFRSFLLVSATILLSAFVAAHQAVIPTAGAQDAAVPATALIVGQAVDGTSGKPLSSVTVTLSSSAAAARGAGGIPAPPTRVLTDGDGHFVFHDLRGGAYTITATRLGCTSGAYGKHSPTGGGQPLDLGEGERKGGVAIALWKLGAIGGRVVDEAGEPVIGLPVKVLHRTFAAGHQYFSQTGNQPQTDDRGVYRISELTPGDYVVAIPTTQATVPSSYLDAMSDASRNGTTSDFMRTMEATGAMGVLHAMSLISGVASVPVGDVHFMPGGPPRPASAESGHLFVYPTIFYPAAPSPAQATVVTIGSGDERSSVDFQIRAVPAVRISGVVTGPTGPLANLGLHLLSNGLGTISRDEGFEVATTISNTAGGFTFLGVPSGSYTVKVLKTPPRPVATSSGFTTVIQVGSSIISSGGGGGPSALPPIPNEPTLWAAIPVTAADSDVTGISVALRTGVRVTGHVEFDGAAPKPTADRLRQLSVQLEPATGRLNDVASSALTRGVLDADGQFNTYQLPAGRYLIRMTAPAGWTLKSAMFEGKDVCDVPLDLDATDVSGVVITFTDRPTELSGTVQNAQGAADASAMVLIFPADSNAWMDYGASNRRMRSLRTQKDGAYRISGMPAGDYFVAAVPDDAAPEWQDPAFLKKLQAAALRITIGDGEKKSLNLLTGSAIK